MAVGQDFIPQNKNGTQKYSEYGGYGVAYIEGGESRIGGFYPLSEPLSEWEKEDFLRFVKENGAEKGSYLVTFDPNTGKLAQVFGKIPRTLTECKNKLSQFCCVLLLRRTAGEQYQNK